MNQVRSFIDKLNGVLPTDPAEQRQRNINYIFVRTIHRMPTIIKLYDKNLKELKNNLLTKEKTLEDLQKIEDRM